MGHSTGSGRGGGTSAAERVEQSINQGIKAINRAAFTNEGNGEWALNVPGYGGGQILDETGSSRDRMYGRGGKLYSARAWDENDRLTTEQERYFYSLNEAKTYIKSELQKRRRDREILNRE